MRARLLALTLVPLVGMTAFAFLWTSDRYERAGHAQAQLETTRIATELADLSVDIDIENNVAAAAGPNSKSLASVGFVRDARAEITTLRAKLDAHAGEIDKLADRKGSWAIRRREARRARPRPQQGRHAEGVALQPDRRLREGDHLPAGDAQGDRPERRRRCHDRQRRQRRARRPSTT